MIAQENAEFADRVVGFVERNGLNPVRAELGLFVLPQRIVAGYVGEPHIFRQVKPLILNTLFAMLPASNSSSPDAEDDSDDDLENVSDKA